MYTWIISILSFVMRLGIIADFFIELVPSVQGVFFRRVQWLCW